MNSDLRSLKQAVTELPDDEERQTLLRLVSETNEIDQQFESLLAEERKKQAKLRRVSLLAIPIFAALLALSAWYIVNALANGYVTERSRVIFAATEPIGFWFLLFWPITGVVVFAVGLISIIRFRLSPGPNPRFEGTGKQSLPVPSALRAPAAPQAKR